MTRDGRRLKVCDRCDLTEDTDREPLPLAAEPAPASADIAALETYLASCVRRRDWHGVSDAANDLRVLEERQRK